jgi:hypothetical protein
MLYNLPYYPQKINIRLEKKRILKLTFL